MEKHKVVYRTLGSLLALPVLGGYVLAVLIMAALMIALTNEPVFTVSQDAYSTLGYHRLVELETKNLRATGKVELPGIRQSLARGFLSPCKRCFFLGCYPVKNAP